MKQRPEHNFHKILIKTTCS